MLTPDGRRTPLGLDIDGAVHGVRVESLGVYSIIVFHQTELP